MDKEIFERRKRELVESIRVAYDLLDTGKTGHVTPQRLAEVDDNHEDNKYNPNEIEDFTREFLKLDENGGLDFEEFYNIILEGFQNPAMLDQGLEIAFKAFDRRKKELIDSEDFKAAMEEFGKVFEDVGEGDGVKDKEWSFDTDEGSDDRRKKLEELKKNEVKQEVDKSQLDEMMAKAALMNVGEIGRDDFYNATEFKLIFQGKGNKKKE